MKSVQLLITVASYPLYLWCFKIFHNKIQNKKILKISEVMRYNIKYIKIYKIEDSEIKTFCLINVTEYPHCFKIGVDGLYLL